MIISHFLELSSQKVEASHFVAGQSAINPKYRDAFSVVQVFPSFLIFKTPCSCSTIKIRQLLYTMGCYSKLFHNILKYSLRNAIINTN